MDEKQEPIVLELNLAELEAINTALEEAVGKRIRRRWTLHDLSSFIRAWDKVGELLKARKEVKDEEVGSSQH